MHPYHLHNHGRSEHQNANKYEKRRTGTHVGVTLFALGNTRWARGSTTDAIADSIWRETSTGISNWGEAVLALKIQ